MTSYRRLLFGAAMFSTLVAVAIIFNYRQVSAQNPNPGSAPVNIVGPLPLPVTGETSVTGTVAVTQSGTWNVGISGTPLPVQDIDNPARHSFQKNGNLLIPSGSRGNDAVLFVAPANRAVVIEFISAQCIVAPGAICSVALQPNANISANFVFLEMSRSASGETASINRYVASQPTHFVIPPGNNLFFFGERNTTAPAGTFVTDTSITVYGHYVDCTTAQPCTPSF
jgi:hypothetical protein